MDDKIEIRVETSEEFESVGAHFDDPNIVNEILRQLDAGNDWSWCVVEVSARYGGYAGYAYLGCCSYANVEAFKNDGYYADMKEAAYEDLIASMKDAVEQGEQAKTLLTELGIKL